MFGFRTRPTTTKQATLYAVVFGSAYVKGAVVLLFLFMLLQPVADASATENDAPEANNTATAAVSEPEPEPEPEPELEPEVVSESEPETDDSDNSDAVEVADDSAEEAGSDTTTTEQTEATTEAETLSQNETDAEAIEGSSEPSSTSSDTANQTTDSDAALETVADQPTTTATKSTTSASAEGSGETAASTTSNEQSTEQEVSSSGGSNASDDTSTKPASSTATTTDADTDDINSSATTTASSTPALIISKEEAAKIIDEMVKNNLGENEHSEILTNTNSETNESSTSGEIDTDEQRATTTETESSPVTETSNIITDDNRYQFSTTECVSVGNGSFYCSEAEAEGVLAADRVYAERDSGGDFEIYFVNDDGSTRVITDNTTDDRAPYYDAVTDQIVWHQLNSGRYQIMRYDLDDGELTTLSDNEVNNMEPMQVAGVTVWQRWVGGDWEIALFDEGKMELVTNNDYHDVAPAVKGDYVMWHTTSDEGEKLMSVYEISTGLTSVIADPEGGYVENPRFVLVYDTTFDNGDKVTKQYDPVTGEVVSVSSEPARPQPPALPDPEPVDEATVLLQNKNPNPREDFDDGVEPTAGNGTTTTTDTVATSSGTVASDVVTPNTSSTTTDITIPAETASSAEAVLPLTEYDLIVEPYSSSSSAQGDSTASSSNGVE